MPNPTPGRSHPFTAAPPTAGVDAAGVITTVDDIRREFYDSAPWSQYITEVQVTPAGPVLIVMDDDSGELYRIAVIPGPNGEVTFGPPVAVLVTYVPAPPEPPEVPGPAIPPGQAPPGPAVETASAYPQGRTIAAAWPDRASSRPGPSSRYGTMNPPAEPGPGRPGKVIRAAVANGLIHPSRAAWWQGELNAGGTRAARVVASLAEVAKGRRLAPRQSAEVRAATEAEHTWTAMYGKAKQPDARDADQPRKIDPMTAREYEDIFEPAAAPPGPGPILPELAGYVPGKFQLAPSDLPPPGQAVASGVTADAQTAPPALGLTMHGKTTAWHTHEHTDGAGGTHDHEHVHRDDSSHDTGPGHAHSAAPAVWEPELASAPGKAARRVTR